MSEGEAFQDQGPSAGTLLRRAREAAGLHVATLAANLKVPVSKLEALEADRYEVLSDAVFARALASSVCRTLKMDPAPVLERLPQPPRPSLAKTAEGINAPFRAASDGPPPGLLNQVTRPVALTVLALLLGALVLILLPFVQRTRDAVMQSIEKSEGQAATGRPEQSTTTPGSASTAVEGVPAAPASAAGAVPTPAGVTQAPEVPGATGSNAAGGMQLRPSTAPLPAAAGSMPVSLAAPVQGSAAADSVVVFRARGPSWVQVKDARGTTVLRKLMEAGESAGAAGVLPLSVTVGSAEFTEVQVRGKPFDLAPLVRDNVARFEVK